MAGSNDFTGQNIQDTYQRVLQISSSGELADGTGSQVPFLFVTASHAVSASHEITFELSSSHAEIADNLTLGANISVGQITASSHISASGKLFINEIENIGVLTLGDPDGNFNASRIIINNPNAVVSIKNADLDLGDGNGGVPCNVNVNGNITASGDISASGYIEADRFTSDGKNAIENTGGAIVVGNQNTYPVKIGRGGITNIHLRGPVTASGDISASGNIIADDAAFQGSLDVATGGVNTDGIKIGGDGNQSFLTNINGLRLQPNTQDPTNVLTAHVTVGEGAHITASGNISASGNVFANSININGEIIRVHDDFIDMPSSGLIVTKGIQAESHITASGNISASGHVEAESIRFRIPNVIGSIPALNTSGTSLFLGNANNWEYIQYGRASDDRHAFIGDITASTGNISASRISTISAGSGSFHILKGDATKATGLEVSGFVSATSITASGDISSSGIFIGNELNFGHPNDKIEYINDKIAIKSKDSSILLTGNVTASGNISASGYVYAERVFLQNNDVIRYSSANSGLYVNGGIQTIGNSTFGNASNDIHKFNGAVTASGNISASGNITAPQFHAGGPGNDGFYIDTLGTKPAIHDGNGSTLTIGTSHPGYLGAGVNIFVTGSDATKGLFIDSVGNITASGDISASGTLIGNAVYIGGDGNGRITENSDNITIKNQVNDKQISIGGVGGSSNLTAATFDFSNKSVIVGTGFSITASKDPIIGLGGNISASGDGYFANVGIGTDNPQQLLHIKGSTPKIRIEAAANGSPQIELKNNQSPDFTIKNVFSDGGFQIASTGGPAKSFVTIGASDGDIIELSGSVHITGLNGNVTASGEVSASAFVEGSRKFNSLPTTTYSAKGDIVYFGGGTVAAGRIYYWNSSGNWTIADHESSEDATGFLAYALGDSISAGMLIRGFVLTSGDVGDPGSPLYLGQSNGTMSTTIPTATGAYVRIVGYCLDNTSAVWFDPDKSWVELV